MKSIRKTLEQAHTALNNANIDHALIGGLSLSHHGIHRATQDVDLLVNGSSKNEIIKTLEKVGFKLYVETEEVMHFTGEVSLDLLLAHRPLSLAMLDNAVLSENLNVKCVAAEDIIGLKIQAYKNNAKRELQDKADILSIISKNNNLDWDKIKHYADIFNEWDTIEKLRSNL